VINRVSGRRYWSVEQKLSMLRDAFGPGGGVRRAMDLHERHVRQMPSLLTSYTNLH